jgi:methylmalonyl-CoA mutase, C-terminal domain
VVVGGIIPDEDIPALKTAGVDEVFQPGASTEAIVNFIRSKARAFSTGGPPEQTQTPS